MPNILDTLNKEQLEAVTHKDGPVLIIAGAGTGKTTVIVNRIAHLIEQESAKADEILALTFTEKAASEMEERVDKMLPFGYVDLWISTFHSFGEKILREHGMDIGLPTDFRLLNEFEQWALIRKNLGDFNLDYYRPMGNPTKFISALVGHFSRAKDEDITPDDYLQYAEQLKKDIDQVAQGEKVKGSKIHSFLNSEGEFDLEIAEQEVDRITEIARAFKIYQQMLLDNNALDFGDLINYMLKLFRERPAILNKYRRQFKYILLDEFQDTNLAQYELIKLLAAPNNNLMVVGDDDQSIYKFRGASITNIMKFSDDYPDTKRIVLINNYRNRQNILDLAHDFVQLNNPNRLEYQLNEKSSDESMKLDKRLKAHTDDKGIIEVLEGEDLNDEIKKVLEKIADIKIADKEATWNDFAILVRAGNSAKDFCASLDQIEFPYQFFASRGLYTKNVIVNSLAYLRLIDNHHDSSAMYRIMNLPIFNFSHKEIIELNRIAHKKTLSLYEVMTNIKNLPVAPETMGKVSLIINLLGRHTAKLKSKNASEVFLAFLNDSGYLKHLLSLDEKVSKEEIGYLNQFMKRIQTFEMGNDDKDLKAFLSELNMEIEAGEQGSLSPDFDSGPESIKVMTMHASKGLEFKYVFLPSMVDKKFPTIERKEPILIPDGLVKEEIPAGDIHLEEERRLFYVAATRAKVGLYFSWAQDYGGARPKKPSRFLVESNLVDAKKGIVSNIKKEKNSLEIQKLQKQERIKNTKDKENEIYIEPKFYSYTQLAAFTNCPYQYRFAHIMKIPSTGKAQFSFGKTMHSTLQKLFILINNKRGVGQGDLFKSTISDEADLISLDEVLNLYQESWVDNWFESKEQKKEYRQNGERIIREFYEKYKNNWPHALFLEKGFNLRVKSEGQIYTIRGSIDRIDEVDGGIKIVDYKTGKPKDKLTFKEKEQLYIYQIAAREIFNQEIKALSFYYLENNEEIEFIGSDKELEKVEGKIIDTIGEIKKGNFPPKPSILCKYCDFSDICEYKMQ